MEIQICNMSHFKAFDMTNLQYEISICKILYNKGTNTSRYHFKCNRLYVLKSEMNEKVDALKKYKFYFIIKTGVINDV